MNVKEKLRRLKKPAGHVTYRYRRGRRMAGPLNSEITRRAIEQSKRTIRSEDRQDGYARYLVHLLDTDGRHPNPLRLVPCANAMCRDAMLDSLVYDPPIPLVCAPVPEALEELAEEIYRWALERCARVYRRRQMAPALQALRLRLQSQRRMTGNMQDVKVVPMQKIKKEKMVVHQSRVLEIAIIPGSKKYKVSQVTEAGKIAVQILSESKVKKLAQRYEIKQVSVRSQVKDHRFN